MCHAGTVQVFNLFFSSMINNQVENPHLIHFLNASGVHPTRSKHKGALRTHNYEDKHSPTVTPQATNRTHNFQGFGMGFTWGKIPI